MSIATLLPVRRFVSMAVLAFTASAWAGEFYEDGAAIKGYDPVAYFKEQKPVKGAPDTRPSTRDRLSSSRPRATAMPSQRIRPGMRRSTTCQCCRQSAQLR